jgi:hypothetical protein
MTQDPILAAIRRALSDERLDAYGPGRSDEEKLAIYLWNMALCESLYPVLHALEVAFRNAVFSAGSAAFAGTATGDVPCWLDADPPLLCPDERRAVASAKQRLRQRSRPLEPGRVVAELSFGFWTTLFDVRYEQNRVLWPRLLGHSLLDRGCPKSMRTRKALSPLLNKVRHLRNRVAHHEPVWHWRDLDAQHALALDLLGWFNPALRAAVEPGDRFPVVHTAGAQPFHQQIRAVMEARMLAEVMKAA